ncbi:unnamed protein product, partial [Laminaria digitata]
QISSIALLLPEVTEATAVVDATACVGGNAISFANSFQEVWAVEIDPDRFKLLRGNVKKAVGSAAASRGVRFFNSDFLDFLEAEKSEIGAKQPVVFLDPPWGGSDYKKQVG